MDTDAPWRALETPESGEASGEPRPASLARRILPAAAAVAIALSVASVVVLQLLPQGGLATSPQAAALISGGGASAPPAASASPALLVVQIAGAVAHPGVYRLPAGSRVADAIAAAGGYGSDVDARAAEDQLNLAAKVADAQLIHIPRRGEAAATGAAAAESAGTEAGGPIDLNQASAAQLDALPGIGPVTASKIIAARQEKPFASIDDLLARKLVSASTLSKIKPLVVVR